MRVRVAAAAAASFLIAWGLCLTAPARAVENFLQDVRVSVHGDVVRSSQDVIVIAIDDAALKHLPFSSPISRNFLAAVVERLDKAKAGVIGLDILLDRPTLPEEDAALAAAVNAAQSPVVLLADSGADKTRRCAGTAPPPAAPLSESVIPAFPGNASFGDGALCIDSLDEVARVAPASRPDAPSFAEALRAAWRGGPAPPFAERSWPIPFATRQGGWAIPIYSADQLDVLPDDWLAGKAVLVGEISPYGPDWRTTPLRFASPEWPIEPANRMPQGKAPGVLIHAYALSALAEGGPAQRPGQVSLAITIALGVVLAAGLSLLRLRLSLVSAAIIGAVAIWLLAVFGLHQSLRWMAPVAGFPAGLLICSGVCFALLERDERRRRRMIHSSFAHFLAPEIVDQLVRNPDLLGRSAQQREITALFTDLAGFTDLVDRYPSDKVADLLNGYLDVIVDCVVRNGGVVDKIVGDAVHALFSVPLETPGHREQALRCALDISAATEDYRRRNEAAALGVTRIGVNSGPALVGNFGGAKRFDYTAHGSTVNVAARLEAANKVFGTRICLSESSLVRAPDLVFREIGLTPIRGVREPVRLFELVAPSASAPQALADYAEAIELSASAPERALGTLERLRAACPEDGLVEFQIGRLRERLAAAPA